MSTFDEQYKLVTDKIAIRDFNFIRLDHTFFQVAINLIENPDDYDLLIQNATHPFVKIILNSFRPLSKSYYPIPDDKKALRHLRMGIQDIENYIYKIRDTSHLDKILVNIFSFVFLYDSSYLNCNVRYLLTSWSQVFRKYDKQCYFTRTPLFNKNRVKKNTYRF